MRKGRLLGIILTGCMASACSQEQHRSFDEKGALELRYPKQSVEEILSAANDEERVKIAGEIIKKVKGQTYLFRGETGDIHVVIGDSALPDRGIELKSPAILKGEVDNPPYRAPRIEVDNIHYVF